MENKKPDDKRKSKFSQLNFNLKNEIFVLIPLDQIFEEVFYVNKSFTLALKSIKRLNYVKNNLKMLIHDVNFTKERVNEIAKTLHYSASDKEVIYDLIAVLLNKKHKRNPTYTFDGNSDLKKSVIFKFIKYNKYIKKLNMRNINIKFKEKNSKNLFEALLKCKSDCLQNLILTKNNIGKNSDDSMFLNQILKKYNKLTELDLEDNDLGFFSIHDFQLIFDGLSSNDKLSVLNLSKTYFCYNNENDMQYLIKFLKKNNSLRFLYIRNSSMGVNREDIYYLNKIISKENSNLKELDLSDNKLGIKDNIEELKNFFYSIADNKSLSDLNLSGNSLCGKDSFTLTNENNNLEIFGKKASNVILKDDNQENIFAHICYAIQFNKYLVNLDLSNNNLGKNKRNISLLKKAITQNIKLKKLILSNNYFESKDKQEIKGLIKKTNKVSLIM